MIGFTPQGEPFRGDLDAPVVMEEFSSYQCGFCGLYFQETFPQVIENYVETGQVLYIFRDFPLPTQPQSSLAAEAANCAGKVGGGEGYWAMHDRLFERQREWSGKGNAGEIFATYAAELGLDAVGFGACLDTGATRDQVEADLADARSKGVRGTPTFFINGRATVGARPYAVFAQLIDATLAGDTLSSDTSANSALNLAPVDALSPDLRQQPLKVQEAYRFAIANPEVLSKIPCYCGCVGSGHRSNLDCYVQAMGPGDEIVFDEHATTCQLCVSIARDVMAKLQGGQSSDEIRAYIERAYSQYGPPTHPLK